MFGAGEKIEQAILNIVLNSIQAMPKGGQILIKTSLLNTENGKKLGCWQKAEKKIEILIKDNGIGISKDNLSKIFYPFFTTKPEGTGLGLSIANSIVEEHKGLIIVNSTEGKGSFFRIQLPIT
jgi:signal transduction histidine kinase